MPAADPDAKIACPTPQHLQAELDALYDILALGEKEETWEKLEKALYRFAQVVRGGGYKHQPMFNDGIGRKGCGLKIAEYMLSDRGRLSGAAIELLQALAPRLHGSFAPLVQIYFDPLIKLFGRPNKVFLKRAEKCLLTIIDNCHIAAIVIELRKGLYDEAATCRRLSSIGIERALGDGGWEVETWTEKSLLALEEGVRKMATDKDPEVRQTGKRVWAKFMQTFPERVDDFSAPLTPTVRRYLNLPAGNGVAAKGKAKAPAPARPPAAKSAAAAPAIKPEPPVKAQHHRIAALVTKPSRATLKPAAPVTAPVPPRDQNGGPSKQSRSPTKPVEAPVHEPKTPRPRSQTRQPKTPPHVEPQAINQPMAPFDPPTKRLDVPVAPTYVRSASHNVLSTADAGPYPLQKPTRPALPQSYSTTSLPVDTNGLQHDAHPPPARTSRFATGPVRIVRPAPMASTDEGSAETVPISVDGFFYTPSGATVLRGPVRPPPTIGHGRRPMGQAQRRVVTAPEAGSSDNVLAKTPAVRRVMSRTVRERVEELDERAASESPIKAAGEAQSTTASPRTGPSTPARIKEANGEQLESRNAPVDHEHGREEIITSLVPISADEHQTIPAEIAAQIPLPPDGDLPTETRTNDNREGTEIVLTKLDVDQNPDKPVEESVQPQTTESNEDTAVESKMVALEDAQPAQAHSSEPSATSAPIDEALPVNAIEAAEVPSVAQSDRDGSTSGRSFVVVEQTSAVDQVKAAGHEDRSIAQAPISNPVSVSNPVVEDTKRPVSRSAASRTLSGRSVKPSSSVSQSTETHSKPIPTANTAPRKPPVPRAVPAAATTARNARPIERKPFRPVTAAESAAAAAARTASVKEKAVPQQRGPDPPIKTAGSTLPSEAVSRTRVVSSQSAASSSAGQAKTVDSTTKAPKASAQAKSDSTTSRPTKPSTLLAPTKASASRAATASTHPHPPVKPIQSTTSASAALPPVRKEKIKLKAALPSFRPVRHAVAPGTAPSTTGQPRSMASSTSSSAPTRRPGAKVKPESIPLPMSPPKESVVAAGSGTNNAKSPSSLSGSGRAKVRPDAIPLPASPVSRSSPTIETSRVSPSSRAGMAKVDPEHVPLPISPSVQEPATLDSIHRGRSTSASIPLLNDLGLPMPTADRFESASTRFKASTAPTASDSDLSDSDPDREEDEDDLTGVTFKVRSETTARESASTSRPPPRPKVIQQASKGDLMEFSAPANRSQNASASARSTPVKITTTPKYTPNRRALVFMDANVRSPLVANVVSGRSHTE